MPMAVGFFGNPLNTFINFILTNPKPLVNLINNNDVINKYNNSIMDIEHNNIINIPPLEDPSINYDYLRPYLAGLIEGDGTIWVGSPPLGGGYLLRYRKKY